MPPCPKNQQGGAAAEKSAYGPTIDPPCAALKQANSSSSVSRSLPLWPLHSYIPSVHHPFVIPLLGFHRAATVRALQHLIIPLLPSLVITPLFLISVSVGFEFLLPFFPLASWTDSAAPTRSSPSQQPLFGSTTRLVLRTCLANTLSPFRAAKQHSNAPARPPDSRSESTIANLAATLDPIKSPLRGDPGYPQYSPSYDQSFSRGADYSQPAYDQPPYNEPVHDQPSFPQTSFNQPAYTEPASHVYNEGYAHREGLVPSAGASSTHHNRFGFLKSKWPAAFMATTAIQAVICLVCESYIFARVQSSLEGDITSDRVRSEYLTIPTFLTLFIFGFLYELVIVGDALRLKNTIQVIGVCVANLALVVYTGIQVDSIQSAVRVLQREGVLITHDSAAATWEDVRPFLVTIPAVISLGTIIMTFICWKLYQVFAWDILKNIGADYRMKRRFLHYQVCPALSPTASLLAKHGLQIYIALLKFDFFFFLGYIVQFVVIVADHRDVEFALTIASIPVTIAILLMAAFFTRRENKAGVITIIFLYLGGLSYFIFKLNRMYQSGYSQHYLAVRRSLTAFAVITILLIVLTIVNAIICMRNFGAGLKAHLLTPHNAEEKPDMNSINLQDAKQPVPSRMTID
ncbi:hypothetical protein S40293_09523 [Stachybotrys chartarum IBT 40293]|nr:hypothetical protein S40293_09523 [Stachybotrys chartarum IBT 40293]